MSAHSIHAITFVWGGLLRHQIQRTGSGRSRQTPRCGRCQGLPRHRRSAPAAGLLPGPWVRRQAAFAMPILHANRVHSPEDTTEVSARFAPCSEMEERSGVVIGRYKPQPADQAAERSQLGGPGGRWRIPPHVPVGRAARPFDRTSCGPFPPRSRACKTRPNGASDGVAKRSQFGGADRIWGWDVISDFLAGIWLSGPCRGWEEPLLSPPGGGVHAAVAALQTLLHV